MSNDASTIVQRLWNYCHVLRDDGVSYTDYVEQLTYLLFLKMADEQAQAGKTSPIDPQYSWSTLVRLEDSDELKRHYQAVLSQLGQGTGMIPTIFRKAQNRIQDPVKLYHLIRLIESKEWNTFDVDVKAEIYEGILERNAQDVKSGAGQYFTPRPLIRAIVDVIQPKSGQTICDPACGTGGFLTIAYDYILKHYELDNALLEHVHSV